MNNEKNKIEMDVYYLNRGIWITKNVEISVLFPLLVIVIFQNLFSTILAILLIMFLVYLNKRGFKYNTALRMVSFFFKKEILAIDDYDNLFQKNRNLHKDGRFTFNDLKKKKIYLNPAEEKKSSLRL
jgi:hypothetical protein